MSLACVQSQSCELKTLRQVEWGFQVCVCPCVCLRSRGLISSLNYRNAFSFHSIPPSHVVPPAFYSFSKTITLSCQSRPSYFCPFLNCAFHLPACLSICPSWWLPAGSLTVCNCFSPSCFPSWVSVFMPMSVLSSLSRAHSHFLHQWNHWAANKPILTRKSKFTPTPLRLWVRVQK